MPAPTALKAAAETPLQEPEASVQTQGKRVFNALLSAFCNHLTESLRVEGDEFLLGEPEAMVVDNADLPTPDEEDGSMAIDEEGRPRFAPARDIVSTQSSSARYGSYAK